jgi:hypothetical protein
MALLAAVATEFLAFASLETVPLDIGYPSETSEWPILLGLPGLIIHAPALMLGSWIGPVYPLFPWRLSLFVLGYLDSLAVVAIILFLWRVGCRFISSQRP